MSIFGRELDALFIVAQVVGFAATGIGIASYQSKYRSNIIALQVFSNVGWIIHYLLLGSYSAVVANAIGTVRNILYGFRGRYKFADSKIIPIVSIAAFVITGIITYENIFDILPMFAMIMASIGFYIENEKTIRRISVFVCTSWLLFAAYNLSIAGVVSETLVLISIIVAMVRYRSFEMYDKTAKDYSLPISREETEGTNN